MDATQDPEASEPAGDSAGQGSITVTVKETNGSPAEDLGRAPAGPKPNHTVDDFSGQMRDDKFGITPGFRMLTEVGSIELLEDENGTILVDFAAQPGPAAIDPYLCIGQASGSTVSCDQILVSNGDPKQAEATERQGGRLMVGVYNGLTVGTTFTLCVSSFQDMPAPDEYAGIVDGVCAKSTTAGQEA